MQNSSTRWVAWPPGSTVIVPMVLDATSTTWHCLAFVKYCLDRKPISQEKLDIFHTTHTTNKESLEILILHCFEYHVGPHISMGMAANGKCNVSSAPWLVNTSKLGGITSFPRASLVIRWHHLLCGQHQNNSTVHTNDFNWAPTWPQNHFKNFTWCLLGVIDVLSLYNNVAQCNHTVSVHQKIYKYVMQCIYTVLLLHNLLRLAVRTNYEMATKWESSIWRPNPKHAIINSNCQVPSASKQKQSLDSVERGR